jgi:hypothetical protein
VFAIAGCSPSSTRLSSTSSPIVGGEVEKPPSVSILARASRHRWTFKR